MTNKNIKATVALIATLIVAFILIKLYDNKNFEFQIIPRPIKNYVDLDSLIDHPNEYILAYVNLPYDYYYGSNLIPVTLAALSSPPGDFLELGMGLFSTPLLHKIAHDQNRRLFSIDTDYDWMKKFIMYNSTKTHKLWHLNTLASFMDYGLDRADWAMVLVDHNHMSQRPLSVIAFAQKAQIVIAHDIEKQNENNYLYRKHKMTEHYKYVCMFTLFRPPSKDGNRDYVSTTLMSNFIDLEAVLAPAFKNVITEYGHVACDKTNS